MLLKEQADTRGFFGIVDVRRGLKRDSRKRKLPITASMRGVLTAALARTKCRHVLTSPESANKPMSPNTLEDQIRRTRSALALPADAGLHALRYTFLTRAGKLTQNVKALQMLAGHSNIATTMKYIHPEEADIFGIVAEMNAKKLPSQRQLESEKTAAKAAGDD